MYTISYPSGTLRKDGVVVPQNDSTPEFQEYLEFLRTGNGPIQVPDPAERPVISINAWQLRMALNRVGLRQAVEDAVAASTDQDIKDGYYHSPTFSSNEPHTLALGAQLGQDEAAMYALFELGSTL